MLQNLLQMNELRVRIARRDDEILRLKNELAARDRAKPVAWMRGVISQAGPEVAAEYDVQLEPGDYPPCGEGWTPLYAHPLKPAATEWR